MNIDQILNDLRAERNRIDDAIRALENGGSGTTRGNGRRRRGANGRRKHRMTAEGRRRLSEMMKKRWADRRKSGKSGRAA